MAKKGQKFANYTPEFKMEAVRLLKAKLPSGCETIRGSFRYSNQTMGEEIQKWGIFGRPASERIVQEACLANGPPEKEVCKYRRRASLCESGGRVLKKAISLSSRKEVIAKKTRFEIIDSLRRKYRLSWLLEIAEVSRAGYYKWRKARERAYGHAQQEHVLKEHIMAIHRLRPYCGYLRMTVALRKAIQ